MLACRQCRADVREELAIFFEGPYCSTECAEAGEVKDAISDKPKGPRCNRCGTQVDSISTCLQCSVLYCYMCQDVTDGPAQYCSRECCDAMAMKRDVMS